MDTQLYKLVQQNLSVGLAIKNYKIMCSTLKQDIKTGKSKQIQESDWKRYFEWEKQGQRYIITYIHNKPLPKEDKRTLGNNSIYLKHIELLLLNYLSKQKGYKATITLKNLCFDMGMINKNYIDDNRKMMIKHDPTINEFQINHFYQRTHQKLKEIVYSSLNNLKNRRLIDYEEVIRINKDGEEHSASDTEKNMIRDVEKEVLNNMGLESITLVHLKFKQKEFYNRVNTILANKYDIDYIYKSIDILFTKKFIDEALTQAEVEIEKIMLNDKLIKAIDKQAENIYNKTEEEYNKKMETFLDSWLFGKAPELKGRFFKHSDVYIFAQEQLSELLLRYLK